jgi:hypothetical protein
MLCGICFSLESFFMYVHAWMIAGEGFNCGTFDKPFMMIEEDLKMWVVYFIFCVPGEHFD